MSQSKELFMQIRDLEQQAFNKEAIINRSIELKQSIVDGDLDALETLILAKKLQELGKQLEEQVRPIAEDKTRLQKNEVLSVHSVDIVEKVIGSRTDFSHCGDPYWEQANNELEAAKIKIKFREQFLSAMKEPTTIVTPDGEIVTINPPIKSGRIGLALTLK